MPFSAPFFFFLFCPGPKRITGNQRSKEYNDGVEKYWGINPYCNIWHRHTLTISNKKIFSIDKKVLNYLNIKI
jgi:hypothetical protein